jgi:hypothetical protein
MTAGVHVEAMNSEGAEKVSSVVDSRFRSAGAKLEAGEFTAVLTAAMDAGFGGRSAAVQTGLGSMPNDASIESRQNSVNSENSKNGADGSRLNERAERKNAVGAGPATGLSSRQDMSAATDTRADTLLRNREEPVKAEHIREEHTKEERIKTDSSQVVAYLGDFPPPAVSSAHVQPVSNEHTVARTALELQDEKGDATSAASAGARVLRAATGEAGSGDGAASKTAEVAAERAEGGSAGDGATDLSPAKTSAANGLMNRSMPAVSRQIGATGELIRAEFIRTDDDAGRVSAAQETSWLYNLDFSRMAAAGSGVEAAAHPEPASNPVAIPVSTKAEMMPEAQGRAVGGQVFSVGALSGSSLDSASKVLKSNLSDRPFGSDSTKGQSKGSFDDSLDDSLGGLNGNRIVEVAVSGPRIMTKADSGRTGSGAVRSQAAISSQSKLQVRGITTTVNAAHGADHSVGGGGTGIPIAKGFDGGSLLSGEAYPTDGLTPFAGSVADRGRDDGTDGEMSETSAIAAHGSVVETRLGVSGGETPGAASGLRSLEVGYQDPTLGYVELRAHLRQDGVHASLVTQSATSGAALQGQLDSLAGWMHERRTPVETLSVLTLDSRGDSRGEAGRQETAADGQNGGGNTEQGSQNNRPDIRLAGQVSAVAVAGAPAQAVMLNPISLSGRTPSVQAGSTISVLA